MHGVGIGKETYGFVAFVAQQNCSIAAGDVRLLVLQQIGLVTLEQDAKKVLLTVGRWCLEGALL